MVLNKKYNDKICKFCKKEFDRKWNKERHEKDKHNFDNKIQIEKNYQQEISDYYNHLRKKRDINNTFCNKNYNSDSNSVINNKNYSSSFDNYHYNNNSSPYPMYPYPNFFNSNINSQPKIEKKEWTTNDRIKVQKALKILQNYLSKISHPRYTYYMIKLLHDRCSSERSIEPLKQFFARKYLGHLWPYDD